MQQSPEWCSTKLYSSIWANCVRSRKSAPKLYCPLDQGAAGDAACDRAKGPVTFGRSQSLAELDPEGQRPEGASNS